MPSRVCPICGKPYQGAACPRCRKRVSRLAAKHGTRSKEQEKARKAANPWRVEYGRVEYRKARQAAVQRSMGRCASCGRKCAELSGGTWRVACGGVHHIRALSQGGSSDVSNLVLLCPSCHNRIDAARRAAMK